MSNQFDGIIFQVAKSTSVPPALIKAVIRAESAFNPMAKRHEANVNDYSFGLMQVRCDTAKWMGYNGPCEGLLDPETNIRVGAKFLQFLIARFPNDIERVIAAYNAGPGNANRPFVNQAYVNRVGGYLREYIAQEQAEKENVVTLRPGQPQTGPVPYSPGSPVRVTATREAEAVNVQTDAIVPEDKLPWVLAGAGVLAYLLLKR